MRHHEPPFNHVTGDIVDTDAVTHPEGAPVDHGIARYQVGDDRRGPQRKDHAEKDRDALERFRARTGDIGVGHHHRKSDGEQPRDPVRRQGPFTVKADKRDGAAIDALEVQPHQSQDIARDDHHDRDKRDTRQALDHSQAHGLQRIQKYRQ